MFAEKYLLKNNNEVLIEIEPDQDVGVIVVIPCFREPEILQTLKSLKQCHLPKSKVEIIVLINHSEMASEAIRNYNWNTKKELQDWMKKNSETGIQFYAVGPVVLQKKWAGAGLARKKGMDEAIRRFNLLGRKDGVLVSLDADTLVENNYLLEIAKHFDSNTKQVGATLRFEHQKDSINEKQLKGIVLYEKYLDYYKRALDYTAYPYSMFTIGSAFAVLAMAYVKRGGMNRRQAGEDFYFLQNLVQIGEVGEITTTKVYPSARLSDRVPFGTGPILQRWMTGKEDLTHTYNFNAFADLKNLFKVKESFYKIDKVKYEIILQALPKSIEAFVQHDNFWSELCDLNNNCATLEAFQNRFFQKFNAFKILKYLNYAHEKFYDKAELKEQLTLLNEKEQT